MCPHLDMFGIISNSGLISTTTTDISSIRMLRWHRLSKAIWDSLSEARIGFRIFSTVDITASTGITSHIPSDARMNLACWSGGIVIAVMSGWAMQHLGPFLIQKEEDKIRSLVVMKCVEVRGTCHQSTSSSLKILQTFHELQGVPSSSEFLSLQWMSSGVSQVDEC